MREYSRHWLDYDPIALLVFILGISAVPLVTLSPFDASITSISWARLRKGERIALPVVGPHGLG
jgi:hypothetical protein